MNLFSNLLDKLYIKQWTYGIGKVTLPTLLTDGIDKVQFKWKQVPSPTRFYADPFIIRLDENRLLVTYEDYIKEDLYGRIALAIVDNNFNTIQEKTLLDTGSHLSYPNLYKKGDKIYILPESSKEGGLHRHELDLTTLELKPKETIIPDLPLLDSTIQFYEGKYWIFATHRGPGSDSQLYIYYADQWDGHYQPHAQNPVKTNLNGSRPAGKTFVYNNTLYRPAQNSSAYYGRAVVLHQIIKLNEHEFEEIPVLEICPPKNSAFNFGLHTINFSNDVIIVDGLRRIFSPWTQLKILFSRSLRVN